MLKGILEGLASCCADWGNAHTHCMFLESAQVTLGLFTLTCVHVRWNSVLCIIWDVGTGVRDPVQALRRMEVPVLHEGLASGRSIH